MHRQRALRRDAACTRRVTDAAVRHTRRLQRALRLRPAAAAALAPQIVGGADMATLQRVYKSRLGPTDVLSFPSSALTTPATRLREDVVTRATLLRHTLDGACAAGDATLGDAPSAAAGAGSTANTFRGNSRGPLRPLPSEGAELLGTLFVCPSEVARRAARRRRPLETQTALTVTHAVAHLLGCDHSTDAEHYEMLRVERRLLARAGCHVGRSGRRRHASPAAHEA